MAAACVTAPLSAQLTPVSHEMTVASGLGENLEVAWPDVPANGGWGSSTSTFAGFTMTSLINGVEAGVLSYAGVDNNSLGVAGAGSFGFARTINTNESASIVEAIRIDLPVAGGPVGPDMTMEFAGMSGFKVGSLLGGPGPADAVSIEGFTADPNVVFIQGEGDVTFDATSGTLVIANPTTDTLVFEFANPEASLSAEGVSLVLSSDTAKANGNGLGLIQWQYLAIVPPEVFEFSEQPQNVTTWSGADVSFSSAVVSGGDVEPTYQWEVSVDDGVSWTPVAGAESATFEIGAVDVALDRNRYRLVVSRGGETLISETAVLRVGDEPAAAPEGVVAYYRFEDGNVGEIATQAQDSSGSGFHLTAVTGEPLYSGDLPAGLLPATGQLNQTALDVGGGAYSIDGVDGDGLSQVEFQDFTIEVWVKFHDLAGFQTIIGRDDRGNQNNHNQGLFRFEKIGGSNEFRVVAWQSGEQDQFFTSNYQLKVGEWTHLAVVGDTQAGTVSLYANGELVGFHDVGFTGLRVPDLDPAWTIGRGQWVEQPADFFNGVIDEVRFSTTALSPVEFLNFPAAVLAFHTHPQDREAEIGAEVIFESLAGGGGSADLSYQWEYSGDGGETWIEIEGATSPSYRIESVGAADDGEYRVVASRGGDVAASDPATLTVSGYPAPVIETSLAVGPLAFEGDDFTYSVVARGLGNLQYQWQKDGEDLSGETGASLELSDLGLDDSGTYSVVVTDDAAAAEGFEPTSVTATSVLTVVPRLKGAISLNFVGTSWSLGTEGRASNRLGIIEPDEVAGLVPVANWNNSAEVTDVAVRDTPLPLLNDEGEPSGATATWSANNTWAARVTSGPVHDKDPNQLLYHGYIEQRAGVGAEEMATVTIEGIPFDTYDVYVYPMNINGLPEEWTRLVTLEDASGERGLYMRSLMGDPTPVEIPFYLTHATTEAEAVEGPATSVMRFGGASGSTIVIRHFDVVGDNLGGVAAVSIVDTSADVPARPGIVEAPSNRFLMAGGNVQLSVVAESFNDGGTLSYQWYKDGEAIAGETDADLSLANVSSADTGNYKVVVTDTSALGASQKTVSASVVVIDGDRPVLLSVDMNVGGHLPMAGHGMLRSGTGLVEFEMAANEQDNPMQIGEGPTLWNGLPGFAGIHTYDRLRDEDGLLLDGVTVTVSGAAGAEDVPADSGGIEPPVEEWSGPLLRDYVFAENDDLLTVTVGGLHAFIGRELTLVVYALGPQSTEWDGGERNDVATVTLAEANNYLELDPLETDQFEGRDLRFNEFAFADFEAVVAMDGTVVWTIGPVPGEPGLNAFNGFQLLLTEAGDVPETSPLEDWRLAHFGTTINEGDAANTADVDGDGFANLLEYAVGTDPKSSDEGRVAVELASDGAALTLAFDHTDDPSLSYQVEATEDLDQPWVVLKSFSFTSAGTQVFVDTTPVDATARRFLRLKVSIQE